MNKYEIKESRIHGKGTFANQDLSINTDIGLAFGRVSNTGNDDKDIERTPLGAYTNHSNHPNCKIVKEGYSYHFVTINKVKKGKELTVDYKTFDWEGERDFALSNEYDEVAAKFCDEVKHLANKQGLQVFIVAYNPKTDNGSSFTSKIDRKDLDNPVTNARLAHERWEVDHSINPKHQR